MPALGRDVFVNCPFDGEFEPLFHAIVFCVVRCGFDPRCALETSDGGDVRIDKIVRLIRECPIGIHDISRTELDQANGLPRFNMPFELGLFLGAKRYGPKGQREKVCLILERTLFTYQKYLSDIAGQDTRAHENDVRKVIGHVRDFLNGLVDRPLPGTDSVFAEYEEFERTLPTIRHEVGLGTGRLSYIDFLSVVGIFVTKDEASDGRSA